MDLDIGVFRRDLEGKIELLEDSEEKLYQKGEDITPEQKHQVGVLYFEYAKICELLGMEKEAADNKLFSQTALREAREASLNNPVYIKEERLMYEHTGEKLPDDLQAAIREQEEKEQQAKQGKSLLRRAIDYVVGSSNGDNGAQFEGEMMADAFRNVDNLGRALSLRQKTDVIKSRNYHEDIARAVERGFVKGMVIASLDDYEFECGVEGEYLRDILSPEEFADVKSLRERILSGDIDLSKMPEHYRQYDFGDRVEVDEDFAEQMKLAEIRLGYLDKKIEKAKEPKQKEALEYLKKQMESLLLIGAVGYDDPQLLIDMGAARQVSGPTDIGTSNERKMFYFINAVTRTLKPYIPQLANRMNGSVSSYEDVYSGWNLLKERFPVFAEAEAIGVREMARALRSLGYQGMRDAVRGFINTSEGTPDCAEGNGAVGLLRRVADTVKQIGYSVEEKVSR